MRCKLPRLKANPSPPKVSSGAGGALGSRRVSLTRVEGGGGTVSDVFVSAAYRCGVRPQSRQAGLNLALSGDSEPTHLSHSKQQLRNIFFFFLAQPNSTSASSKTANKPVPIAKLESELNSGKREGENLPRRSMLP